MQIVQWILSQCLAIHDVTPERLHILIKTVHLETSVSETRQVVHIDQQQHKHLHDTSWSDYTDSIINKSTYTLAICCTTLQSPRNGTTFLLSWNEANRGLSRLTALWKHLSKTHVISNVTSMIDFVHPSMMNIMRFYTCRFGDRPDYLFNPACHRWHNSLLQ